MKKTLLAVAKSTTVAGIGLVLAMSSPAGADVITDWNQTAIAAMKAANVVGNPWTRNLAIMHVAMSDAVNTVQSKYTIYAAAGPSNPSASAEAAAVGAAQRVLLQQLPGQKALIEQAFVETTKAIPEGPPGRRALRSARSAPPPSLRTALLTAQTCPTLIGR